MLTTPIARVDRSALHEAVAQVALVAQRDRLVVEDQRKLSAEIAEALTAAGFACHFVPRRWGGQAGTFTSLLKAASGLAETCASTAWCATLYAAHGRLSAYLPLEGQYDLWGTSPDVRIAASIVPPQGEATDVGNSWRLSGRWAFASGVDHADWVLLASWTHRGDRREHRIFAVPRADVTIVDTWRTMGLRGTGSNSVLLDDVLVPAHRTFTLDELLRPQADAARCHTVPYPMVGSLLFAVPILGAARGAQRAWLARMAAKRQTDGRPARLALPVQQVLARSSAEIHAAELLLDRAAARADHAPVNPLSTAENQRDAAMAADLCSTAVDRLFRATGAHGQTEQDPVQRQWRDITTAASHAALNFDAAAAAYASAAFVHEEGGTG